MTKAELIQELQDCDVPQDAEVICLSGYIHDTPVSVWYKETNGPVYVDSQRPADRDTPTIVLEPTVGLPEGHDNGWVARMRDGRGGSFARYGSTPTEALERILEAQEFATAVERARLMVGTSIVVAVLAPIVYLLGGVL